MIALGLRAADAIEIAIARRMPSASSCMTPAQPRRTNRPPRPAGPLLAWHSYSAAGARADVKAITRLVPRRDNGRDRDVAQAAARRPGERPKAITPGAAADT